MTPLKAFYIFLQAFMICLFTILSSTRPFCYILTRTEFSLFILYKSLFLTSPNTLSQELYTV